MSAPTMTLAGAARVFTTAAVLMEAEKDHLLHEIGRHVRDGARHLIGQENVAGAGPYAAWAPLAESTVEDKNRRGYGGQVSPTDPLLRTGELRSSIVFHVDLGQSSVTIGSGLELAVFQELGTQHIPPRSFLGIAAERAKPFILSRVLQAVLVVVRTAQQAIAPHGPANAPPHQYSEEALRRPPPPDDWEGEIVGHSSGPMVPLDRRWL